MVRLKSSLALVSSCSWSGVRCLSRWQSGNRLLGSDPRSVSWRLCKIRSSRPKALSARLGAAPGFVCKGEVARRSLRLLLAVLWVFYPTFLLIGGCGRRAEGAGCEGGFSTLRLGAAWAACDEPQQVFLWDKEVFPQFADSSRKWARFCHPSGCPGGRGFGSALALTAVPPLLHASRGWLQEGPRCGSLRQNAALTRVRFPSFKKWVLVHQTTACTELTKALTQVMLANGITCFDDANYLSPRPRLQRRAALGLGFARAPVPAACDSLGCGGLLPAAPPKLWKRSRALGAPRHGCLPQHCTTGSGGTTQAFLGWDHRITESENSRGWKGQNHRITE